MVAPHQTALWFGSRGAELSWPELSGRRASIISELLQVLRDEEQFDYCVDVTAAHYPEREKQFDVIWILYSFAAN